MRIIVAEDMAMLREVLCKACREFGHEVVASCETVRESIALVTQHMPDLLLLDLVLRDGNGFAVSDALKERLMPVKVLAITSHLDDYILCQAQCRHLHGFIDKNTDVVRTVGQALAAIDQNRCYFSGAYEQARMRQQGDAQNFRKYLTDWECEILSHIGQGLNDEEIASMLRLSPRTIQAHRSRILLKLRIPNTPKLIVWAFSHGFVRPVAARRINQPGAGP